jgi:hypothetical protein
LRTKAPLPLLRQADSTMKTERPVRARKASAQGAGSKKHCLKKTMLSIGIASKMRAKNKIFFYQSKTDSYKNIKIDIFCFNIFLIIFCFNFVYFLFLGGTAGSSGVQVDIL